MAWLIYALGGGWGHLVRAVAIAKAVPKSVEIHILTNSPHHLVVREYVATRLGNVTIHLVSKKDIANFSNYWQNLCRYYQIQLVIVDTFGRGLLGELVDHLPEYLPKVLLARDLNPEYIHKFQLADFMLKNYDLIIPIEAVDYLSIPALETPIVICTVQEILSLDYARSILLAGVEQTEYPIVLICGSGNADEWQWFRDQQVQLQKQFHQFQFVLVNHFPLMELYSAVNGVIGSGGYNTVGECLVTGIPLCAVAFARLYDRQAVRIAKHCHRGVHPLSDLSSLILSKPKEIQHYQSGAEEVIARILAKGLL